MAQSLPCAVYSRQKGPLPPHTGGRSVRSAGHAHAGRGLFCWEGTADATRRGCVLGERLRRAILRAGGRHQPGRRPLPDPAAHRRARLRGRRQLLRRGRAAAARAADARPRRVRPADPQEEGVGGRRGRGRGRRAVDAHQRRKAGRPPGQRPVRPGRRRDPAGRPQSEVSGRVPAHAPRPGAGDRRRPAAGDRRARQDPGPDDPPARPRPAELARVDRPGFRAESQSDEGDPRWRGSG